MHLQYEPLQEPRSAGLSLELHFHTIAIIMFLSTHMSHM